jgi:DNA polymerase III epsilon subunit-like protein
VCQEAEELAQRTEDRAEASSWAQEVLANPGAIVLDTETTDLDGEVIELAITTMRGSVLFEGLVCPRGAISPGAHAVHGLTHLDLLEALPWPHLYEQVRAILTGASVIVAYNADFDQAVLDRTCTQYGLPLLSEATRDRWACAMQWYAQWWGEWSDYHGEYRWQPLGGGHRAHEDCLAVLERLRTMAGGAAVRDLQDNGREA